MRRIFNPASPLGRGLAHLYFLDGRSSRFFPDLVSGNHLIGGSTANLSAKDGPYGAGTTTNGNYRENNLAPSVIGSHGLASADSEKTIACWVSLTVTAAALYSIRGDTGTPVLDLCVGGNGLSGVNGHFTCLTRSDAGELYEIPSSVLVNDGNPHCLVWRRKSSKLQTLFVDGVPRGNVTDAMTSGITGSLNADSAGNIQVASEYLNPGITSFFGHYHALAIWDRGLDDQEIFDISQTPNVLLKRSYRRRLFEAAAPTGDIAGSQTITITNAGTLTGTGSIAGANAMSFTNSGSTGSVGVLAGSNDIVFANSGDITGIGELVGSSDITFANSGTLDAPVGSMVGTNAITFTTSGTLIGAGELAGTDAITLGNAGTISGSGALAGANALAFDNTGTLELPGAIAGTIDITFTGIGVLSGVGELSGVNSMAFGNTLRNDFAQTDTENVGAGGKRRRRGHRFERYVEREELEEKLAEELVGKPKIKKKVVRIIADVVANTDESADTAVERLRASLEVTNEPMRGDYIDALNILLAFSSDRLSNRGISIDNLDLDDETIAMVFLELS